MVDRGLVRLVRMSWKVAVAGIHIESGTFTPLRTKREDFFPLRGLEMLERYPFLQKCEFSDLEILPLVHFRAMPGGMIAAADYAEMKGEIIDRLQALPQEPDAFYFDVHGAMTVEGLEDAEADLLEAIRGRLPINAWVACSQDLHGNVSPRLLALLDLITTYRTAPHIDWMETRERALRLLLRALREKRLPVMAYVPIPVLVSGEMSSTEYEPGRSLYEPLVEEAQQEGMWDVSLWVGYAWADQERAGAIALVLADGSEQAKKAAEKIAQRYWDARREMCFVSPAATFDDCWQQACHTTERPFFLSDAGDNPTAGAAGDVTDTLSKVLLANAQLEQKMRVIYASIPDAPACQAMLDAGIGAWISLSLGGKLDPIHGQALDVSGEVRALVPGEDAQGVLHVDGVDIIVSSRRRPYHRRDDFLRLCLDPLLSDVTIVKIGYLEPELKSMARQHRIILSPGGVRADFWNMPYHQRKRPLYPFERDFDWRPVAKIQSSARIFPSLPQCSQRL